MAPQKTSTMDAYLINLINNFRISDFFDIAVITILSYVILVWFKKTASRFVLLGIIILTVIYTLSRIFHMYLTEYVLQGFFAILLIAMIVIFQEDLRRFFERLATWRIIRKDSIHSSPYHEAEVLTQAIKGLMKKRYGALIVIKGEDFLDRHLEGGHTLEGKLSTALLESIFDPHSIGHDGAVIIADGTIEKFGCHLPLSINPRKFGNLGLRHTAALGMAERSDAFCIVVSEERGTVSFARNGVIARLRDVADLKDRLVQFYGEKTPPSTGGLWFRWIRENSPEKALALLIACGLWLAFGYQTESIRRDFAVPIVMKNLPSEWIIEDQYPKEANITLMGSQQAFDLLNVPSLRAVLDMSLVKEGTLELPLDGNQIQYPSNLTLVRIQPNQIRFTAHQMIRVETPVEVRTAGTLPPGYRLVKITINPAMVHVSTLKKELKPLQKIVTEPIDISRLTETTKVTPRLLLPEEVQFMDKKQPAVEVTIEIAPITEDEPLPEQPATSS